MKTFESADPNATPQDGRPTVKRVADIMAGVATVGRACAALRAAGWSSTIAGNRITVDGQVFARYLDPDPRGPSDARWLIYGDDGQPAFQIVAAFEAS